MQIHIRMLPNTLLALYSAHAKGSKNYIGCGYTVTVEPLYNGHHWESRFVRYREVSLVERFHIFDINFNGHNNYNIIVIHIT